MLRLAILFGLVGLAAATCIIVWSGYQPILDALRAAGWGILWTSLSHLVSMLACTVGWRGLMSRHARPSYFYLLYVLWVRGAVNHLMPVARVGGEIVSVRLLTRHGVPRGAAVSSTIVELTLSMAAIFLFVLSGVFLLSQRVSGSDIGWKLAAGLLASTPLIAALAAVQRYGVFGLLDKIFTLALKDTWTNFAGNIRQLDRSIHAVYRRRHRVLKGFFWELVSWTSCAGEIWLGLYFLGHPIGIVDCFIIEAIIEGATAAAFAIPGALGVQEAGFLYFGHLLGLPPDIAVALAVIRRCRDLILFLPGLVIWQLQEGRWLWKRAA